MLAASRCISCVCWVSFWLLRIFFVRAWPRVVCTRFAPFFAPLFPLCIACAYPVNDWHRQVPHDSKRVYTWPNRQAKKKIGAWEQLLCVVLFVCYLPSETSRCSFCLRRLCVFPRDIIPLVFAPFAARHNPSLCVNFLHLDQVLTDFFSRG